ncbi:MAG: hypothetical protein OEQ74_01905 [Gammaproteobacteria bacterium]|nr:hypothetical protein [Gammaproteobacteria bacterium]
MFEFLKKLRRETPIEPVVEATETSGLDHLESANTMADVLPGVRHLAMNLSIRAPDHEIEPSLNNRSFGPQSRAFFHFRCKNVDCVDGGFDLQEDIQTAVTEGRNDLSGRRLCHGWRNAAMVGQQKCYFELNFKAHISYTDKA